MSTPESGTDPIRQFVGRECRIRLNDAALGVQPLWFDKIQPRTLDWQVAGQDAHAVSGRPDSRNNRMVNSQVRPNQKDLAFLTELLEAGKVVPVIVGRHPLTELAKAIRYYGDGHSRGKVVITV